jgi:serine/threonine protein phosphatase PrpC
VIFAAKTHVGMRRANNEDSFYIPGSAKLPFMVVADGMGGHNSGEVASAEAIRFVVEYVHGVEPKVIEQTPLRVIHNAIDAANLYIYRMGGAKEGMQGMGTTFTAAMFLGDKAYIGHVGDSRAYHITGGRLYCVTEDHSVVQELLSQGAITPKQAKVHPHRNMITRALGTQRKLTVDLFEVNWRAQEVLLICSDGLTNYLSDDELENIILSRLRKKNSVQQETLDMICEQLIGYALARGGSDNISVAIALNDGGRD